MVLAAVHGILVFRVDTCDLVSVDAKQNDSGNQLLVVSLCSPTSSELRGCVKVEVNVLGSPSLIVSKVCVDVKQHLADRAQELCESRGGHAGLPVPNKPYGLSVWT